MRRLDTSELAFYEASRRAVTNCVIAAELDRPPEPASLRRAVDRVQARHPLLRVRVEHVGVPRFVGEDVPRIPIAVVQRTPRGFVAEAGRELGHALPFATGPLVRFTLVRGGDDEPAELLLTFSHMIGDGFSGAAIVRDLLAALRDPDRPLAPRELRPPLAEQLSTLGLPLPGLGLFGRALDLAGDALARLGGAAGPPVAPAGSRHETSSWTLDEAATARVLARCRAEASSVYGLLCATLLTEIARHRGSAARVSLATPINIRPLFDPPADEDVGIYAYAPSLTLQVHPDEPRWPLARRIADRVQWARRLFVPRAAGLSMRALRPWIAGLADAPLAAWARRSLAAEVVASNVGVIPTFEPAAGVRVVNVSMFAMIPGVDLVMVSQTHAGRMTLNFVHTVPAARPGLAEAAREGVLAGVRGA